MVTVGRCGVALLLALLLAGCSDTSTPSAGPGGATVPPASSAHADSSASSTETPTETASGTASGTASDSPTTPVPTPYRPHPAEYDAAAKRVAARAVERMPKVQQVTYTQYFGYQPPLASILVEADFAAGGGTTYDVRISERDGAWTVDSITAAARPRPAADPGRWARRVLASDRIDLPWAGRRDVAAGLIADSVLRSMLTVAREHRIGVSVLVGAHPVLVFGTDRRSDHPDGLAYDIGRIDGRLVVAPGSAGLVREVMAAAAGTGAYQVGGPVDPDGGGSAYFSDVTHSEHIHVGFSS